MKIAVLTGGNSLEREISLGAGRDCSEALRELGHEVIIIDVDRKLPSVLVDVNPDVAFIALHGRHVEDGVIQGLLEWIGIPYTHSGVLSSALAMNKQQSKTILEKAGVPVAKSVIATKEQIEKGHVIPPPYVVKPVNEGSSLGGLWLVEAKSDSPIIIESDEYAHYMVESYAPGRELTAGILGDRKLAVSEFLLEGKLYDYDAKHNALDSNRILPAQIPQDIYDACLEYALLAHQALGCRGLTRTDFRWDEAKGIDGIVALELNSQPGLRKNSNAGQQAAYVGISFPELCQWLVDDASLDR